jgi:hypothetical protein
MFNFQRSASESPSIAAIHRQKNICCRIVFTHIPKFNLFRIVIFNFKNINFIIH